MQKMENLANQNNNRKNNINIKRILLIYGKLNTGGIEILIIRMIKWLCSNGYFVTLFLTDGQGELIDKLEGIDNLIILANDKYSAHSKSRLNKMILSLPNKFFYELKIFYIYYLYFKNEKYDLIYSFNPETFIISYLFDGEKYLSGVYHPKTYYRKHRQKIIKYLDRLDHNYQNKIVFMNESVKYHTEKYFNSKLNGFIFPLPIAINETDRPIKEHFDFVRYESNKIISIGRIVDFKTYNFYMIDIMESLHKEYPKIEYHIYGFGPLENQLIEKISNSSSRNVIFFHGGVKHNKMKDVLKDCFCFI